MDLESKVRLFTLANSLAENSLDKLESSLNINLGRNHKEPVKERDYYAQFESEFRNEAREMAKHYEVFYCLERSIRGLVIQLLSEKFGESWWEESVKLDIRTNVDNNIKREADSGFTQRSEEKIDYTTFGELTQIVTSNWEVFELNFRSQRAFSKIMTNLNLLRGPIAHCCPLAEDEVVRLQLTVKDWFRLMS